MNYNDKAWARKRSHILRRDGWIDQVELQKGRKIEANVVHHILPAEDYPEYRYSDWNLISISNATHKRLHEKYTGKLSREGMELAQFTAWKNGVKMTERILIIGKPGTGKSTWAKKHLGGGLCYELDAIACAFRLTVPHKEEVNPAARRMAAALRSGWLKAAEQYTHRILIVRTAPDIKELEETKPDRIVVCTQIWDIRPYQYDEADYDRQIREAEEWARRNGVTIEYYPERV